MVRGRISVRDEAEPQIVADSIRPIDGAAPGPEAARQGAAPRRLCIRLPSRDADARRRVELLQEMFPGRDQMIVYFADTGKKFGAGCVIRTALCAS